MIRKTTVALLLSTACLCAQTPATVSDMGEEEGIEEAPDRAMPAHERAELIAWLRAQYAQPSDKWPAPTLDAGIAHREIGPITEPPPAPEGNPTTPEKARLGMSLFFDPRLSGSQQISCASCHEPQLGWSNGAAFSSGVHRQRLRRNPPTLAGTGYAKTLFHDGRVSSLEEQAEAVMLNPMEMDGNPTQIVERLEKAGVYYSPLFEKAFGSVEVTFQRVQEAIAAFQRSIRVGNTRFDKFAKGDHSALNDSELAGLHLFRTKARCLNCHMGPMFTDGDFHNLGLTYYGRKYQDLGRYEVTRKPEDVGKFQTPTLRNIDRTGPYFHNGVFPSLEGVLRLYNVGMPRPQRKENQRDDPLFPSTSEHIQRLDLTAQELADLRAFLSTLTEPPVRVLAPPIPPIEE